MQEMSQSITSGQYSDNLYWQYAEERNGLSVLERPWGFVLYSELEDAQSLFIDTMFVTKKERRNGRGMELLAEIENKAKASRLYRIVCTCDPKANGSSVSMAAILAAGFKLDSAEGGLVYLVKELV